MRGALHESLCDGAGLFALSGGDDHRTLSAEHWGARQRSGAPLRRSDACQDSESQRLSNRIRWQVASWRDWQAGVGAERLMEDSRHKKFMFNRGHWKKFAMEPDGPAVARRTTAGNRRMRVDGADAKSFSTDFLTDRTIELIRQSKDKPFLAVVSYPDPHGPNTVRAPYDRMYNHLRFLAPRTYGRDDMPSPGWLGGGKNHAVFPW